MNFTIGKQKKQIVFLVKTPDCRKIGANKKNASVGTNALFVYHVRSMTVFSLGEFFVLLLLLPVVLRPLLHKAGTTDRISIFAPFAFFISVLLVFADGLSVETISICAISFFIFFFNIRALVRCFQRLPVDLFSAGAKIACFLGFVLICATGHFVFKKYPFKDIYRINKSNLAYVSQQKQLYSGSFEKGFVPRDRKQKTSAEFYTFKFEGKPQRPEPVQKFEIKTAFEGLLKKQPENEQAENTAETAAKIDGNAEIAETAQNANLTASAEAVTMQTETAPAAGNGTNSAAAENGENTKEAAETEQKIIIYLPDVFTYVQENSITIKALAAKGYAVISADFFDQNRPYFNDWHNGNFVRSFYARYLAAYQPEDFDRQYFTVLKTHELYAIVSYLKEQNLADKIACVVADGEAAQAAQNYNKLTQSSLPVFALNENIPGYVPGMGNLALLQSAVYYHIQQSPTDGWTQAQIIAQRVQKFIEKQELK